MGVTRIAGTPPPSPHNGTCVDECKRFTRRTNQLRIDHLQIDHADPKLPPWDVVQDMYSTVHIQPRKHVVHRADYMAPTLKQHGLLIDHTSTDYDYFCPVTGRPRSLSGDGWSPWSVRCVIFSADGWSSALHFNAWYRQAWLGLPWPGLVWRLFPLL